MNPAEKLHRDALKHLVQARQTMQKLMAVSDDWSAKGMLDSDFNSLEESIREFGRCQLLIPDSHSKN